MSETAMDPEILRQRWRVRIDNAKTSGGTWTVEERLANGVPLADTYGAECALATDAGDYVMVPTAMRQLPLLEHLAEAHNLWLDSQPLGGARR